MNYELLLLQVSAHLLADFYFQPERWCVRKQEKVFSMAHFYHVIVVFLFAWLMSLNLTFWLPALLIASFHLFVDLLKSTITIRFPGQWKKSYLYFLDQGLHFLGLTAVTVCYSRTHVVEYLIQPDLFMVAVLAAIVFCGKPANYLLKNILQAFDIEMPMEENLSERSLANAGKLIGVTERYLTLMLILAGQLAGVGLILAAKSILRFNTPSKNEYILVGTLLSFGLATFIGLLLSLLVGSPG